MLLIIFIAAVFTLTSPSAIRIGASRLLYSPTFKGPSPIWYDPDMLQHGCYLIKSYHDLTGKELVNMKLFNSDPLEAAKVLFLDHQQVVVSHGTQKELENGPILNYGNTAALHRWGASWEQLTSMPSRFTAEPMERSVRDDFMRRVTADGIVNDYQGIRIALDGKRFRISGASVWNVVIDGIYLGQAAAFRDVSDL